MNIGSVLRYYRLLNGYTQSEVSDKALINEKYYGRIERGESCPTFDVVGDLLKVLNMNYSSIANVCQKNYKTEYLFLPEDLVKGRFISEISPRFVASVLKDRKKENAYIGSSSKLSTMIDIYGKTVLLDYRKYNEKYKCSVFALLEKDISILVNLNCINDIFEELYSVGVLSGYNWYGRGESEKTINGYKTDYYWEQEKIIVENKTIMSKGELCKYPNTESKRLEKQVKKMVALNEKGFNIRVNFFVLTPWTTKLEFDENVELLLNKKGRTGIDVFFYYLFYDKGILKVKRIIADKMDGVYNLKFHKSK